jgi:hypothetical protein
MRDVDARCHVDHCVAEALTQTSSTSQRKTRGCISSEIAVDSWNEIDYRTTNWYDQEPKIEGLHLEVSGRWRQAEWFEPGVDFAMQEFRHEEELIF